MSMPCVQRQLENVGTALCWSGQAIIGGKHMGDSLNSPKRTSLSEWTERFVHEIGDYGPALKALKRITGSEAERKIVLELLFHHVHGNYGFGASARDWKAFKSELNAVRRRALAFSSDMQRFSHLRIFSLNLLMPAAFLAREGDAFPWRQTTDSPHGVFLSSAAEELARLADYIDYVITAGDKTWNARDWKNLILVLLSIYLKEVTKKWQDETIGTLVHIAYRAAGKHWKSEKNPGAAIAELRRRFHAPQSRLERLHLNLRQHSPDPRLMKRHRDESSIQGELDRSLTRRHRFADFVGIMAAGQTKDVNDSLLGFINLFMVYERDSCGFLCPEC
jgi:hypothetical protein